MCSQVFELQHHKYGGDHADCGILHRCTSSKRPLLGLELCSLDCGQCHTRSGVDRSAICTALLVGALQAEDVDQWEMWECQVQQRDNGASENNRDLRRCTQHIINPKKSFSLELSVKCLGKEGFNIVSPC